jgi:heme A synthase
LPGVGGLVLLVQIGIGGLTVLQKNEDWATTLHLATATIFFFLATASLFFAYLRPLPVAREVRIAAAPSSTRTVYPGEEP